MRQDSCEAQFLWKKTWNLRAVGCITYKFTVTLNARRALLEKTQGIWKGCCNACFPWKIRNSGAVGRVSIFSHIDRKTHFAWKKTGNLGVGPTQFFLGKHNDSARSVTGCISIYNQNESHAHFMWYIHNDFSGVGSRLRRGCIVYSNKEQRWGGVGWGG